MNSPKYNKKVERGYIYLSISFSWDTFLLLALRYQTSGFGAPGSWALWFRPGLTPLIPLVLKTSGLKWNYITSFLGPPACRWDVIGLFSLHNHMSQSFTIIFFCIYPSISIFCLSVYLSSIFYLFISYWFCKREKSQSPNDVTCAKAHDTKPRHNIWPHCCFNLSQKW